jgi:hypothetical protein
MQIKRQHKQGPPVAIRKRVHSLGFVLGPSLPVGKAGYGSHFLNGQAE